MRVPLFLIGFAAVFSKAALAEDVCSCWTPDPENIAAAEAKITSHLLPLGSLGRYVRYYAGTISHGRRFIRGKLVPASSGEEPGVHIVEGRMPPLQGDGCVTRSEPDRTFVYLRCARPGSWTPTDVQIAGLEGVLRLDLTKLGPFRPGVLSQYARHYAGVTEADHRQIIGKYVILKDVIPRDETPGIHIESEAELPSVAGGGCSFVTVRYDLSTKAITSWCNGII